jgi:hypothetical protein
MCMLPGESQKCGEQLEMTRMTPKATWAFVPFGAYNAGAGVWGLGQILNWAMLNEP